MFVSNNVNVAHTSTPEVPQQYMPSGQNSDNTISSLPWAHGVTSAQLSFVVWKMLTFSEERFVGVSEAEPSTDIDHSSAGKP